MKFKWIYAESDLPIRDQIIQNRKFTESFFSEGWNELPDPTLMKDMEKAANRIITALVNKEKIMIYGHDDMDGITSAYILYDFLTKLGSQSHSYFIPNREIDSHGMKENFLSELEQGKYDLCITVDGGISEFEAVDKINSLGCDVIITDHHLVQENIPHAFAVVNPKQQDCNYPYDMLAGVGIAYLLVETLCSMNSMEIPESYVFWVAVGSIADKAPLTGVNRIIAKHVIQNWEEFQPVYSTLLEDRVKSNSMSSKFQAIYGIISLLSNGRETGGNHLGLECLINRSNTKSLSRLRNMKRANETEMMKARRFLRKINIQSEKLGFIYNDEKGEVPVHLMGYCASVLSKKYKIPIIFLQKKGDIISSEARSTEGCHLLDCFDFISSEFIQYGGHAKAAGFTMNPENQPAFEEKFEQYITQHEAEIKNHQQIKIDAIISYDNMDELDNFLHSYLPYLQPFGQGNKPPLILMKNVRRDRLDKRFNFNGIHTDLYDLNIVFEANGSYLNVIDFQAAN